MHRHGLIGISLALLLHVSTPAAAASGVTGLTCEGRVAPALVDTLAPRFSWRLESNARGVVQRAYELEVAREAADGAEVEVVASTGRIESDQTQWVEVPRLRLQPRCAYTWRVRIWAGAGEASAWSDSTRFHTGLLGEPWPAAWISDGRKIGVNEWPPARYFRKTFVLDHRPVRARLYVSALGLVQPWLNGRKVSEDLFSPGWPDYRKRAFYVAYDVTNLMADRANTLGLVLGDGWYSGTLLPKHQYGATPMVSAWLELTAADGTITRVSTDGNGEWAEGPITRQGIYVGESFDARREDESWSTPHGGTAWTWQAVTVEPTPAIAMDARLSEPVRRIETIKPVSSRAVAPGVHLLDLGQNMVGWVRLKVQAPAGQEITLRFTEMLEADGSLHTRNLRSAEATARYVAKGQGVETWEPRFTYFGFRYVQVSGLETLPEDAITGVVVHTDLERTGHFECSDPLINQLYRNTIWGQKGNFLELPTDCPQRDERLGWTGDAQVFCHTANYNFQSGSFYRQWLAALRDSYQPDGPDPGYGAVAPSIGFKTGSAGWADAMTVVPWMTYLHTGDRRLIAENFADARRWVAVMQAQASDGIRRSPRSYGDWLAPGYLPREAPTPYELIATAYYAYSTHLVARMAEVLGEDALVAQYNALFEAVRAAFQREFIDADGKITSGEQTACLLALAFGLVSEEQRPRMIGHLKSAIAAHDFHLSTGFIGTPLLASTLSEVGLTDLAYRIVRQETYPGWLFSVKNGATTVWERWDSWTPEDGFNAQGMNSFNHYAYGSVVGWFYDTVAGIKPDPIPPGWKHFILAPEPGGDLSFARATVQTPRGEIRSHWQTHDRGLSWEVSIPPNTHALVRVPAASAKQVTESGKPLGTLISDDAWGEADGRVSFELPSGTYHFEVNP